MHTHRDTFNRWLDHLARPRLAIFKHRISSYKICGLAGMALALLLNIGLTAHRHLSFWVLAALVVNALLTFYILALATRIIAGEELLIYYHHEIAIIITSGLVLWFLDQPVLLYLDHTILGLGMFLACGRLGCLMVGCCHGRPHRWGISYHREHAAAGFENFLVGVRLFPVQALEAGWVLAVVIAGCLLVLKDYPPGEALALYTMVYGAGRFCFEFVRGDSRRPYWIGFSEAQWTTVILMMLTLAAEVSGLLTWHAWHAALAIAVIAAMIMLTVIQGAMAHDRLPLGHPRYVKELAEIIDRLPEPTLAGQQATLSSVAVESTSTGLQISKGRIAGPPADIRHYALCQKNELMTAKRARRLGTLIQQLRHPVDVLEIRLGNQGIYHLIFRVSN
jgi:hypothetical protein